MNLDVEIVCPQCLGVGFVEDRNVLDLLCGCDLCGGYGKGMNVVNTDLELILGTGKTTLAKVWKVYKIEEEEKETDTSASIKNNQRAL